MKNIACAACVVLGGLLQTALAFFWISLFSFLTLEPGTDVYSDLLVPRGDWKKPPPATISKTEALRDIAVLQRIIDGSYINRRPGEDDAKWQRIYDGMRAGVAAAEEPIRTTNFQKLLHESLLPLGDCHFGLAGTDENGKLNGSLMCERQFAFISEFAFRNDEDRRIVLKSPKVEVRPGDEFLDCDIAGGRAFVAPFGRADEDDLVVERRLLALAPSTEPTPWQCRFRTSAGVVATAVAFRRFWPPALPGPIFAGRTPTKNWPLVAVSSFGIRSGERFDATLAAARAAAAEPSPAFFDVRGNEGGDGKRATRLAAAAAPGLAQTDEFHGVLSDVALQGLLNARRDEFRTKRLPLWKTAASLARDSVLEGLRLLFRARHRGGSFRDTGDARATIVARGSRRLTLLIQNNECLSACELFVRHARTAPDAIAVGENTGGMMRTGGNFSYRLPASGLAVSVSMAEFAQPGEPPFPEGTGLLPDLWMEVHAREMDFPIFEKCIDDAQCRAALLALRRERGGGARAGDDPFGSPSNISFQSDRYFINEAASE